MKNTTKKLNALQKEIIRWGIFAVVILVLNVTLRPSYDKYIENDHRQSCFTARMHGAEIYMDNANDLISSGANPEKLDYFSLIQNAFQETYGVKVNEDLTINGLCPSGGVMHIVIDSESHELTITCDAENHDVFVQSDWYYYTD